MDKKDFDKLYNKVEDIDSRLDTVDKTLIAQHATLEHHIERTEIAEKRLGHIEDVLYDKVLKHINQVDGALKLLGIISIVLGIAAGLYKFFV